LGGQEEIKNYNEEKVLRKTLSEEINLLIPIIYGVDKFVVWSLEDGRKTVGF
jgi:hypothetical protein